MSNHMGAGNARAARLSLKAALGVGTATVFVTATAVFAGRSVWPKIFTPDSRIVALASSVLVILAVASIFDGIMCIFRGKHFLFPRCSRIVCCSCTADRCGVWYSASVSVTGLMRTCSSLLLMTFSSTSEQVSISCFTS